MILAGIDIGTNTLRLLIAETGPGSFHEIHSDRRITRLGESLDSTGRLSAGARERSLAVLSEFCTSISSAGCTGVSAVGTSALRNAGNSGQFLEEVKKRTGLAIRIIDGTEEARLTLLGISHALRSDPLERGTMVIDIGGGSTEVVAGNPLFEASLPLGAVYLTERFLAHDPPKPEELEQLQTYVVGTLRSLLPSTLQANRLIGTAGTITTLASMNQRLAVYAPDRINGAQLKRDWINETVRCLAISTKAERHMMPGLEAGREDIILAGAVILQNIMERWQFQDLTVSDWGLREGILFDLYARMKATG